MATTLFFRELKGYIHILNYSCDKIQSFKQDEGKYLIANLDKHLLIKERVSLGTYNFLYKTRDQIKNDNGVLWFFVMLGEGVGKDGYVTFLAEVGLW